jgi:hypothetical protein
MAISGVEPEIQTLSLSREVEIGAPLEVTFRAVLAEIGPGSELPDGKPFPMVIEPWPGGRWFRDLGNNAGHLWGHVQVIKPPTLLELCGPMFMSFPGLNHIQYRLRPDGEKATILQFTHRAMGPLTDEHREGIGHGWDHALKRVAAIAARLAAEG